MKNGVVRAFFVPTNPQTASQTTIRQNLRVTAQAWRGLTTVQRQSFEAGAQSGDWKVTDPLTGTLRNPRSGFNLYTELNRNLFNVGAAAITTLPAKVSFTAITLGAITMDASAGTVSIVYAGVLGANETLVFRATPPLSAGRMRVPKNALRNVTVSNAVTPVNGANYTTVFGAITAATGKVVFYECWIVSTVSGQKSFVGTSRVVIVA